MKEQYLKMKDSFLYKKAHRIVVVSIIGVSIALISTFFDIIYKTGFLNYILDSLLFIFSLIFLIIFRNIKLKEINKYAIKKIKVNKKEVK